MASSKILRHYSLERNPFVDRTAEKSNLSDDSYYILSDLQGFAPNETTYLFFGKRGSGKTTIRMQMQRAYDAYNAENDTFSSKGARPHFVVDLCKPGHITACLRNFQAYLGCDADSWDAKFSDTWESADLVDCILSFAATQLVDDVRVGDARSDQIINMFLKNDKARKQFLLLAHLYANADFNTMAELRSKLMHGRSMLVLAATAAGTLAGTAIAALGAQAVVEKQSGAMHKVLKEVCDKALPKSLHNPKVLAAVGVGAAVGAYALSSRRASATSTRRAQQLVHPIHVVPHPALDVLQSVVDALFAPADTADAVRSQYIGISGHQKLELLQSLVKVVGYQSVAVFGDCFDEVTLLDPVAYPQALKCFAREVCRNDILNFGRLHFFFPDSRIALDLNTDKVLKEARFDRHFVRDLVWSRHQLEDLAERRFRACQAGGKNADEMPRFSDLFSKVGAEDFSSYLAKLHTPRELMIMMTEMLARIEAHNEDDYTVAAQDMEIAVSKAAEHTV